jgi:oligopeptide/dipeptide ABC transporter ATP-binding protein
MRVQELVVEPLIAHGLADRREQARRARELLEMVGLSAAAANRYPHEFSGGQKQRIAIARALSLNPEVVVLDEPVSALDVSIRAQIVNLLQDIQEELDLSFLLIAHDLAVVEHMGHTVAVMYLGGVVEIGPGEGLSREPLHPYTQALMSAAPVPDPTVKVEPLPLYGELPSPNNPPAGCRFHTRCPHAMPVCSEIVPELKEQRPNHSVACHLY